MSSITSVTAAIEAAANDFAEIRQRALYKIEALLVIQAWVIEHNINNFHNKRIFAVWVEGELAFSATDGWRYDGIPILGPRPSAAAIDKLELLKLNTLMAEIVRLAYDARVALPQTPPNMQDTLTAPVAMSTQDTPAPTRC